MFTFRRRYGSASAASQKPRNGLVLALGLWAAAGCRGSPARPSPDTEARAACTSACAALVTSGCDQPGQRPSDQARCVEACVDWAARASAVRCGPDSLRYLGCVGGSRLDCGTTSPASVCLEHGLSVPACRAAYEKLARCLAPCAQAGVSHVVDRHDGGVSVKAELVGAGCEPCRELRPGAPSGARCEAASVCGESCCECPDGRTRYRVRACVGSECQAGERACKDARRLSPHDPCAAE